MRRAYEISTENGIFGRDLENWLQAERKLVWKPAVERREKGDGVRRALLSNAPQLAEPNGP